MSAEAFATLLRTGPSQTFVGNLETIVTLAEIGDVAVPCTINDGRPTCYICCPSVAYVDYARAELRLIGVPQPVAVATLPLLTLGRALVRIAGLDRQVQPNNWLIATNPTPYLKTGDLAALIARMTLAHPTHAVVWRSLNACSDGGLLAMMRGAGWVLLPARMVYLFDCRTTAPKIGRDEARDREMLVASGYEVVDGAQFSPADFARTATLYKMLYLEKYTHLNPQYTDTFIGGLVRASLLDLKGLRASDGRLDGIVGFFDGRAVMTAPIVGYDTSQPQTAGLYRMLMAIAFERARTRRMLFNASAGADSFKRNRGATPTLEYSAVYVRHLPSHRRLAAQILATLLTRIGVPIMKRYVA